MTRDDGIGDQMQEGHDGREDQDDAAHPPAPARGHQVVHVAPGEISLVARQPEQ